MFSGRPLYRHALHKLSGIETYVDTDSELVLSELASDEQFGEILSRVVVWNFRSSGVLQHSVFECSSFDEVADLFVAV